MLEDRAAVRQVAWRELFPWLILFRSFRVAVSPPVLCLASLGALLTPIGWGLATDLFDGANAAPPAVVALPAVDSRLLSWREASSADAAGFLGEAWRTNVCGVYWLFAKPLGVLFADRVTVRDVAHGAFTGLWNLAVWALFAGAITRIAVVRLGREERVGLRDALRYAARHYAWNVAAPLFPLAGAFACALPVALLGFLMRWDIGVVLGGLLWGLALLAGLAIAIFLGGLALGWPLMWPAISCEESGDAFEAFSRSYSYVFHRPLNYLFYATLILAFGLLSWLLVWAAASLTTEAACWAAAWGAGGTRMREIVAADGQTGLLWAGAALLRCGVLAVRIIAAGFNHAFFWCAAGAIYLCLRRDVDATEFDEVFVEHETTRYQLSPVVAESAETNDAVASSSTGIGAETPGDSGSDQRSDVN